jgi:hypothetical protein
MRRAQLLAALDGWHGWAGIDAGSWPCVVANIGAMAEASSFSPASIHAPRCAPLSVQEASSSR